MKNNTPVNIPAEKLHPFEGHPFKVLNNEEMNQLTQSVQEMGILSPLIVRPARKSEQCGSPNPTKSPAIVSGITSIPAP